MTEKVQSIYIKGKRHYPLPNGDTVPSVSTFLDILPKPALVNWKLKTTAEWAVLHKDAWKDLPQDAAVEVISKATNYDKTAADMGTIAHAIFEDLANGREPQYVPPGFESVAQHWREFVAEFQVEVLYAEPWLAHTTLRYSGSADLICSLVLPGTTERIYACVDFKSGGGLYGSTAYQLAAYSMCDQLLLDAGRTIIEPPKITHTFGMWVRPHGWALRPMSYDDEMERVVRGVRWLYDRVQDDWRYMGKALNEHPVRTRGDNWEIKE